MIFKKKQKKEQTTQEILKSFEQLQEKVNELQEQVEQLKQENKEMLQNIGLVRFNPFSATGGDQSFALAILNKNNTGAIITSIYTSEGSSVYGKPIEKGKSKYILSEEEKKAIQLALKQDIFEKISNRKRKK